MILRKELRLYEKLKINEGAFKKPIIKKNSPVKKKIYTNKRRKKS